MKLNFSMTSSNDYSPSPSVFGSRPTSGYEFLDHTADVQIHAWGKDLKESFEQAAKAMFAYMTDLDTVEEQGTHIIEAEVRHKHYVIKL